MDYLTCPHCKNVLLRDKLTDLLIKRRSIIEFLLIEINRNELEINSIKEQGEKLKSVQKQIIFIENVMEFNK